MKMTNNQAASDSLTGNPSTNMKNTVNTTKLIKTTVATAAIALLAQLQLPAQTWQTVDDFQYTAGKHSFAFGSGADGLGNLYVVGRGIDSANVNHALVMRTANQGATWQTIEDYNYLPGTNTAFVGFGVDPAQNLYALGSVNLGASGTHWLVRKSADGGATWQTSDEFVYQAGWVQGAQAGFAADNSGNIYVAGYAYPTSGPQAGIMVWIVRKSSNAGTSWSTVDVYQYNGYSTPAMAIASSPAGVFVAGYGGLHWIVRKSTDAGQTWSIVDNYAYPNASGSSLGGLTVDNEGNLFTAGRVTVTTVIRKRSTTHNYWVIRQGTNGGTAWSNVQVSENAVFVYGMGSDAAGNVYVVGGPNWVVWKGTNSGTSWSVADSFLYDGLTTSRAYGCASDGLGNVYVCGYGTDSTGVDHWLVRKATP